MGYAGDGIDNSYGSTGYGAPPDSQYGGFGAPAASNMLSYGFLEAGYHYQNPKNSTLEGSHGLGLSLSAQLFKPLYVRGGFDWSLSRGGGSKSKEYDLTTATLGVGAYLPIASRFHLVAEVGGIYTKLDADRDRLSFTEGGIYARPYFRFTPVDPIELQGGATFTSLNDYDTVVIDVSAYFRLLSQLDLGLGVDFGDESTGFTGGIRFRW
jgi:hypothetical protein